MTLLNLRSRTDTDYEDTGEYSLSFWASAELDVAGIVRAAREVGEQVDERFIPHGKVQVGTAAKVRSAGFDLIPTDWPGHYSLIFPLRPTDVELQRVLDAFDAPIDNPEGRLR